MYRITSTSFLLATSSFFIEGAMAVHDVLVARQATSSSSSSTPTSSSIPLEPYLIFQPIPQAVTCEPLKFTWFYNGPDEIFAFFATNVGVPQFPAPASAPLILTPHRSNTFTDARRAVPTGAYSLPLITTTVAFAADVPGSVSTITWPVVTVPQGWYIINATMQSEPYVFFSSEFYVRTGADTSCLPPTDSTGTTSAGSTTIPIGGSSTGGAGTGTIIGATIGSAAFVAAVFAIWMCFLHRRRKRSRAQGGGGGGGDFRKGLAHRWNGLSSTDAELTGGGVTKSYQNRAHRVDSMATIQMSPSEAVAAEKYETTGKFDDDITSNGHGVALDYLPVLTQHEQAKAPPLARSYSTSSSVTAHGAQHQNDVYASTPAPLRRASIGHGRQSVDSTTYPPSSPTRYSTHGQVLAKTQSIPANLGYHSSEPQGDNNNDNNTTSPVDGTTKYTHRHSLGRKRKPVPAYDPNENPTSPVSPAAFQVPSVPPSAYPLNPFSSPEPSTNGGAGGHYATRSQLGHDHSSPDLTRKSSFGPGGVEGKPLHYLIPDMPIPLKH